MSDLFRHQPGSSVIHRLPAGPKLLGLFVASIVVMVLRGPVISLVGLGIAIGIALLARVRWRRLLWSLRGLMVILVMISAYQVWQNGVPRAVAIVADLLTVVLLASVVTMTTPVDRMLDAITDGLRPLRPIGVKPGRVALAVTLTLQMIPVALDLLAQSRDAARARGLERSIRARMVPTVVRMVAHARTTGDALWARGVDELDEVDR